MPSPQKGAKRAREGSEGGRKVQLSDPTEKGTKRRLHFDTSYDTRDLRLVEVPPNLIDIVSSGQHLKIVGDVSKGDTVLCSDNHTFSLRKVETSNAIFLVAPSSTADFSLECGISDYYEIKPIAGNIGKIKELLSAHMYSGSDSESSSNASHSHFFTRKQLWEKVQASDAEMEASLNSLGIVEINGYMRMLHPEAISALSRDLLDTAMVFNPEFTLLELLACITSSYSFKC